METIDSVANRVVSATPAISPRTSNISPAYRAEVGKVIVKIRLVCSLPAFETKELAPAIEAFCEVLHGVVPAERLNDCYLYAARHRNSTYPLAVTELIEAWRIINADEAARRKSACGLCKGEGGAM